MVRNIVPVLLATAVAIVTPTQASICPSDTAEGCVSSQCASSTTPQRCAEQCATLCAGSQQAPHVVIVIIDDMGMHDVGWTSVKSEGAPLTPYLDELAAESLLLPNFYVQPMCSPTRSAFLTGRYPIRTGLQHFVLQPVQPGGMPTDIKTLPQELQERGYATHLVGKWHLGHSSEEYLPWNRGFDNFYGMYLSESDHYTHDARTDNWDFPALDLNRNGVPVFNETGVYSTDLLTREGQTIIENHDASSPLFLYMSYLAVHEPIQAPAEFVEMNAHLTDAVRDMPGCSPAGDVSRRDFGGMVTSVDEGIRQLTETLEEQGMWDNTVFMFFTDNGANIEVGGSNYPFRGSKGSHWESAMRVPAFIHAPPALLPSRGESFEGLMHITDLYPTLVGLSGSVPTYEDMDGHDMWFSMASNDPSVSTRTEVLLGLDPYGVDDVYNDVICPRESQFVQSRSAAIRVGDWKLITGFPGRGDWIDPITFEIETGYNPFDKEFYLFNLAEDPYERNDLSAEEPTIMKELIDKIEEYDLVSVPPLNPDSMLAPIPFLPSFTAGLPSLHPERGDPQCAEFEGCWQPWENVESTKEAAL